MDKAFKQYCFIILAKHEITKLGFIEIVVPSISIPGHSILNSFCKNNLKIKYKDEILTINKLLSRLNIDTYGKQRSVVFIESPITEDAILNALAGEYDCGSKIIGKEFIEKAKENLGQYDYAEVFGSEFCLIEINKIRNVDFIERVVFQTNEMFLFQNITLQEAAIARVSKRILNEISEEINNPKRKNSSSNYEKLMCELSRSRSFLDVDKFVLPAVKISAEKIARNFGMDRCLAQYNENKENLEQLIGLHKLRIEEISNKFINMILLILAIIQIIPIVSDIFEKIVENKIDRIFVLSKLSSIFFCFLLLIIFNLVKRNVINSNFKKKVF